MDRRKYAYICGETEVLRERDRWKVKVKNDYSQITVLELNLKMF